MFYLRYLCYYVSFGFSFTVTARRELMESYVMLLKASKQACLCRYVPTYAQHRHEDLVGIGHYLVFWSCGLLASSSGATKHAQLVLYR